MRLKSVSRLGCLLIACVHVVAGRARWVVRARGTGARHRLPARSGRCRRRAARPRWSRARAAIHDRVITLDTHNDISANNFTADVQLHACV